MAYSDFDKFKAFFLALNRSNYHPEKMDPKIITPQDKAYCFNWLLKEIPELKGKNNNDLIEFLRDPKKVKSYIAGKFTKGESAELTKTLEEKPAATEGIIYQQESSPTEQTTPVGTTTSTSAGGMPFGIPSAPSIPSMPRAPEPPKPDIAIANSRRYNFSSFRSSLSSAFKKTQNLASPAGPFLKVNSGRIGNGLKNMFGRTANLGGRAGLGAINHGGNFLSNLSGARSRFSAGASSLSPKNLGSKRALLIFGGIFFLIFFMGALGGMGGTTPTGEAAPLPPSSGIVPPPPAGGNYQNWIQTYFNVDVGALTPTEIQWASEILSLSLTDAPKFQSLIKAQSTVIKYGAGSHTDNTVNPGITYLKQGYDVATFKLIFIHELSHRIKGLAGNPSPSCGLLDINKAYLGDLNYLTSYAANATSDPNKTCVPGGSDPATRSDEDFAETIAYYINQPIYKSELNYGENCGTYGNTNPYDRNNTMTHKAYAKCLLGP